MAKIELIDNEPTDSKKLYRKYYKLIEGYRLDPENFEQYRSYFAPILKDLEEFYCSAIDNWRKIKGLKRLIGWWAILMEDIGHRHMH